MVCDTAFLLNMTQEMVFMKRMIIIHETQDLNAITSIFNIPPLSKIFKNLLKTTFFIK